MVSRSIGTLQQVIWDVLTKKKYICPNRVNNKPTISNSTSYPAVTTTTTNTKPTCYNKKPCTTQPKSKVSINKLIKIFNVLMRNVVSNLV